MTRFTLLAIALSVASISAFAPAATPNNRATAMNLVPEQGRQLVAFSQDYLSKKAKESASKASNLTSPRRRHSSSDGPRSSQGSRMAAATRSLITRLLGDEEVKAPVADAVEAELNPVHQHHSDDEVLYPIVGFNLVDGHAVPMPGQQAACNLNMQRKGDEQEVGFWSRFSRG